MPGWDANVELLKGGDALLKETVAPVDDQLRAELYRQFAMNLSQGYFLLFQTDPDYPEFVPSRIRPSCSCPIPIRSIIICVSMDAGSIVWSVSAATAPSSASPPAARSSACPMCRARASAITISTVSRSVSMVGSRSSSAPNRRRS
jgi:hypothetical protein